MSLRDQLLKSGLANKGQANKAEKDSKKRRYEQTKQDRPGMDSISQEIEAKRDEQKKADRDRNLRREQERQDREAAFRAMDIMVSGDLLQSSAQIAYYFLMDDGRIAHIVVTEAQQSQLAAGNLAIVSFDKDYRFFLVDATTADRIRSCNPALVLCCHPPEKS